MDWESLEKSVSECRGCQLSHGRLKTVFGVGNHEAPVLVCGEAPGEEEANQGKPFVGKSGKYLRKLMFNAGFRLEHLWITNVLHCRTPDNREPLEEEISACLEFLKAQLLLVKPKAVITVGQVAARAFFRLCEIKEKKKITTIRGDWYDATVEGHVFKIMPVWHPSYVLRQGMKLREQELFRDLRRARKAVIGEVNPGEEAKGRSDGGGKGVGGDVSV